MDGDIFICGTCKQQFNEVNIYMGHKEICNITNGHACNYVTNPTHVSAPNPHCSVDGQMGSISDPSLAPGPVHHDHAYFHYEAPALVASVHDVPSTANPHQPNTGLLMDMLSSLDTTQMAPSFTEQVVEDFIPPPPPPPMPPPQPSQQHHQAPHGPPSSQPAPGQPIVAMTNSLAEPHHQHHHHHPMQQGVHIQQHQQHQMQQHQQQQQHQHQMQQQHQQQQPLHEPEPRQQHPQPQPQQLQQPNIHQTMQHPQPQHQQVQQQLHPEAHHHMQHIQPQIQHSEPHQQHQFHLQQQQQHPQHQQQHPQHQQQHPQHQQQQQHPQQQQFHLQHQHQQHQAPPPPPQHQPQHQPQQQQPPTASVYTAQMGMTMNSQASPMLGGGGYLASVQRSEPVLVVSNGVLCVLYVNQLQTYVSQQPMLSSGVIDSSHLYCTHPPADITCPGGEMTAAGPAQMPQQQPPPPPPAPARAPETSSTPQRPEGTRTRIKALTEGTSPEGPPGPGQVLSRMGTPRLQCQFCCRRFRRNFDLQMHVRTHTGEKPFQCIVCGRAFAQRCNVKRHMESHKVWPAAATGGSGTLPDIHTFEVRLAENRQLIVRPTKSIDHVMERREYRVLYGNGRGGRSGGGGDGSSGANNAASGGGVRKTEETIVLVDNCWECRFCRSRFEDFQKLRSHMRLHTDEQVYLCVLSDCQQTFKLLDAFVEHLEEHQKKKEMVYVCHVCHRTFLTVQQLGEHYNDHCKDPAGSSRSGEANGDIGATSAAEAGEKVTYKCPHCGHLFRRPSSLQAHIVTMHKVHVDAPNTASSMSGLFTCSHCEKAFNTESALRYHIQIHATLAQFQCSTCPKAFKTRQYLRIHERTEHEHNSPFTCSRCSRGFLSRPALRTHVLSAHEPEKKLKCPLAEATGCAFETANAASIASHLSTHSSVLRRPYPCAHCGWRFANALMLRRHLKKHRNAMARKAGGGGGNGGVGGSEASELRCALCGRQFLRRVPFDNHVIMCRQASEERERRARRRARQVELMLEPQPPPPPPPPPSNMTEPEEEPEVERGDDEEGEGEGEAEAMSESRRPQRKRKFTVFWKPKRQKRRRRKAPELDAMAAAIATTAAATGGPGAAGGAENELKSSSVCAEEEEEEEEGSDAYEELAGGDHASSGLRHHTGDVYDPMGSMASIIGCEPASSGPSLPGIATFNQAITAHHLVGGVKRENDFLDMSVLVVRPPNQNAPYTCSEDLKLLECGDQFEEGGARGGTGYPASVGCVVKQGMDF